MSEARSNRLVKMLTLCLRRGFAFCALAIAIEAKSLAAQPAPCGVTSIQELNALEYPPIAHVAHVEGNVIVLLNFAKDGSVEAVHPISGSPLLINTTNNYLKGLKANPYGGPRECPFVASFHLEGPSDVECGYEKAQPLRGPAKLIDLQHVSITRSNVCVTVMRDPIGYPIHHFLFLHWYKKPPSSVGE